MNKKQREIIFNKYDGHCSYCGCDLAGTRWHVDHAKPIGRKQKSTGAVFVELGTGRELADKDFEGETFPKFEYRKSKLVPNGCHHPENDNIENMMPSCASCNISKSGMDIEGFRRFISGFVNSLNKINPQYRVAKRYGLIEETGKLVIFYFEKHK